jgi:large subunit ribosomal protein L25
MAEKQEITVDAQLRQGRGKNDARRVRAAGLVPLTVYGGEGEPVAAVALLKDLAKILRSESGHNTVFTVNVEGAGSSEVMFYDRQIDPIKGRLVHADLKRLVFGQKIEVTVAIHLIGDPYGVREEGGMLEQVLREVDIKVSPRDIPESIDVDVTDLKVHDVLHVSDLKVGQNIEIVSPPETVVAVVSVVREEEVPVVEEEAPTEPEVEAKGKKEEEG